MKEILIITGIAFCLAKSKLFQPFREYITTKSNKYKYLNFASYLVNCPSCSTVWIGTIFSLFLGLSNMLLFAFGSHLLAYIVDAFVENLKRR